LRRDWDILRERQDSSGGVAHLPQQGDLRYTVPVIYPVREWIMLKADMWRKKQPKEKLRAEATFAN